jgi:uncharacterized protein (DUF4415 family)
MKITYDPVKREQTIQDRGLDFEDACHVVWGKPMNGKSHNSDRSLGSNLDRVDAHEVKAEEFEEIPELTDESVKRGRWFVAGSEASPEEGKAAFRKALKRGRPKASAPKISTTIRLDAEVLEAFRATGPGWQTRLNRVLRDWLREHPRKKIKKWSSRIKIP